MKKLHSKVKIALGLMSGTSIDGLDMALCRFWQDDSQQWHYQLLAAANFEYEAKLRQKLIEATEMTALELAQFEVELSRLWAKNVKQFLRQQAVIPDLIAMHGHTVFHRPEEGLTLQIGKGALMCEWCGITTVCDFRSGDVALGGQGAPLVPIGDELLFGQYGACLNLGGIANISYRDKGRRIAYDISPCNMAFNQLANALHLAYDPQGENAAKGTVNEALLRQLNELDFYRIEGAKSLGKEWFQSQFLPILQASSLNIYDKLRTVSVHIATQIGKHIRQSKASQTLVTGGGAKNRFLIELIQKEIDSKLIIPEELLIDYKEAIIFAFLGVLRLRGEHNCLAAVTGAQRNSCAGGVYETVKTVKDWIPKQPAKALIIGHDPRLQQSDTIAPFVLFADFYFREEPQKRPDKNKFGLAKSTFEQIIEITGNKIKPEEIYLTNLCNMPLPHAPKGKTVLITENHAREGIEHIRQILKENPTIEYIFPMSLQVNYLLQKLGFYFSNLEFIEQSEPKEEGVVNIPPYYEAKKDYRHPFLLICGNQYMVKGENQIVIPILHSKNYPLKGRFLSYSDSYNRIKEYFE